MVREKLLRGGNAARGEKKKFEEVAGKPRIYDV
jgi:hypothetical protein